MQQDDVMPSILDREISSANEDAFGHRHFALALRSLIESDDHQPPFSIGLLGGWGTGKSSIKELYTNQLRDDATKTGGQTRAQRIHCITFNAWRFGGRDQDIKRALLRHVFLELGGTEENLQDRLFRQISETREQPKSFRDMTVDLLRAWALPLPALVIAFALLFLLLFVGDLIFRPGDLLRAVLFVCISFLYAYVLKHVKPSEVKASHPLTRVSLPSTTSEQFEDMLLSQLQRYKDGTSKSPDGRVGKTCERLVVFVDDLDRLSADEMVLGLDAVRTFMEIPKSRLPDGLGLVFVISCDEGKVADALAKGRRSGELPATVFNHFDARRYLDRIFQFRLEIPPPPRNDMRDYATRQLKSLTHISSDLENRGIAFPPLIDRMIHVGVSDPRNALQIVNAFAQSWWIAIRREREGVGSSRPGGLHEGAVTRHPISLGALSAMKVSFPDFYRDLQEDPLFLHAFTDVIVRGRALDGLPESSRKRLAERYLLPLSQQPETIELRPEHRPLRQFIASLGGVRWADPLQSLLLLSEDPTTRRLGANISAVYGAFVSGDTRGVLEGMGRHTDGSMLSQEQARNLYQLYEATVNETSARRSNAARVVADLIGRVPDPLAAVLLGELCRDLDNSLNLRSQLGPERIVALMSEAVPSDRKSVTSRLIEDLLTPGRPVALQLESMGTPNLNEAVDMVRTLVPCALSTRAAGGLEAHAEQLLQDWLIERNVQAGGNALIQLPYRDLESWLSEDSGNVAEALGVRYLGALAGELQKDENYTFDVKSALSRMKAISSKLMRTGEEARQELWRLLPTYVSLRDVHAVQVAWEVGVPALGNVNEQQASAFIGEFAQRLQQDDVSDDDNIIDQDVAFGPISNAVTESLHALDDTALASVTNLINHWSTGDETAGYACDMAGRLLPLGREVEEGILGNWAPRLLSALPVPCARYLASRFTDQGKAVQGNIVSALQQTISVDQIGDAMRLRFVAFVGAVPAVAWGTPPLLDYLNSLLTQLAARFNNPNGYLSAILPVVAPVLLNATPSVYGQQVQQLFSQAKGQAGHYPLLHKCMTGYWAAQSSERNPYSPASIYDDARAFVQTFPSPENVSILGSMKDMLQRGLVPEAGRPKLIDAISIVWKSAPSETVDFVADYPQFTAQQAYALLTSVDAANPTQFSALKRAWLHVSETMEEPGIAETMRMLLVNGPVNASQEQDIGLGLWLDVQKDQGRALLSRYLLASDIADEQRLRTWRHAIGRAKALGAAFFLEIVPQLVILPGIDLTGKALFDDGDAITAVLGSRDNQSQLARMLMNAFPEAKSNTVKGQICAYCMKLVGQAALKSFKPDVLAQEELQIIEGAFGASNDIARLRRLVTQS
ncbi:P-loop NTPase fold protein [Paraburkholderia sabiae]|uniref:P-loop NTPase fold protein n=1 Tax=Paraburkholderia sabiae TaxID=273251 RepID=A0ABU9QLN7_9BURK|nr:P-loop NTPase fold protein [Paraburkholderia sabiae]WJZ77373.1 P-loop NTPase fold protein [Paraburkholderia sabiae]CAD6547568.1 hypothetical protein LMG24235_04443 [Paraburkholderia sabiae]